MDRAPAAPPDRPEAPEHERTYHRMFDGDFAWEVRQALLLAVLHTIAAPRIGPVIAATGKYKADMHERNMAIVRAVYPAIRYGLGNERVLRRIRHMNTQHQRYEVDTADILYPLALFVVMPARFIERYGWRQLTPAEVDASVEFYRSFGTAMDLPNLPADYRGFVDLVDRYEARAERPNATIAQVLRTELRMVRGLAPRPLRALVGQYHLALLDARLCEAAGVTPRPRWWRGTVHLALRARARAVALRRRGRSAART